MINIKIKDGIVPIININIEYWMNKNFKEGLSSIESLILISLFIKYRIKKLIMNLGCPISNVLIII
ncbi:MAG: hypothetical protein ACTSRH_13245 [Promethearchaeota archaeon]